MDPKKNFKNKNVVVMGLGLFGGGIASARFCLKYGANVIVTDLQSKEKLSFSLSSFTNEEKECITFILGGHQEKDFEQADIVIVNPAVPRKNKFLKIAKEHGASFENDASLFMRFCKNPVVAITGTRGKTTTTNWIAQLLTLTIGETKPIGNTPNNPLLNALSFKEQMREVGPPSLKREYVHIAELSSWQLELLPQSKKAPHIAVITNIYPDHLNRYDNIEHYASAKANIFTHQTKNDFLILNYDNDWHDFILNKKPLSSLFFFSKKSLPEKLNGIYIKNGIAVIRKNGKEIPLVSLEDFEEKWGTHNTENILASLLAIYLFDPAIKITGTHITKLSGIPFRQQTIYKSDTLQVVNDTTATSPDGFIAAVDRFNGDNTIFIAGGTRKDISFEKAAKHVLQHIPPERLILLSGSATDDFLESLKGVKYDTSDIHIFDELEDCVSCALSKIKETRGKIIFSPASASFEKFNNEFHRGKVFNEIISRLVK
ncbi:MAG: UDP-N-acetylmuramoyl-L-alanine--D-glutamate ligase [Candidatus Pacebacteria bacterium]|nr:UDP-N-acetylmuramoyl-L-alanine--D-glutamate ligase [Candidatus Paceibacterota bacterium]